MGSLTLPTSGSVYLDTNEIIYTVERFPAYFPLLAPLWQSVQAGHLEAVSSELALMEAMVGPLKTGNSVLEKAYENALLGIRLIPITQPILRAASRLRATTRLRTPDALHAATAQAAGCALFVTNDVKFRGTVGLALTVLDDLLIP